MKRDIPVSMMGESPTVIERYFRLVREGQSPRMAEILACRRAPGLETDTSHYAGLKPLEETAGYEYAKKTKAQARAAGISINDSSIYNATIADERQGGDPNAWLLAGDGRDKFRNVIRSKGGFCESLGVQANGKSIEIQAKKEARFKRAKARREEMAGGPIQD